MPKSDFFKYSKRNGSVLVAALLLGLNACVLSLLCMATANKMTEEFSVFARALERENIAREALELTHEYFIAWADREFYSEGVLSGSRRNPSPITEIPSFIYASLADTSGAAINGVIIDLNYADSFENEARLQEIPTGLPSLITVGASGGRGSVFRSARYELRATVTLRSAYGKSYTMKQGLLLLTNVEDGSLYKLTLYIKK